MALDITAVESWLWEAACIIRGPVDAPKFKDYILPLIFLKRLSDVFEDEIKRMEEDFGSRQKALKLADADHKLVRFFVPENARWASVAKQTKGVGEYLTDAVRAVAKVNPRLQGVIDVTDFNATQAGQRILDDDRLSALVQRLSIHRLGLDDVEPNLFGDNNTTAPGIILVVNRRKRHAGQILLVNGSKKFSKGRPKNYLEPAHITALADAYLNWKAVDGLSAVISTADVAKNDYNLSPSRYVSTGGPTPVVPLDEAVVELREAEEEMEVANRELEKVLKRLGLG